MAAGYGGSKGTCREKVNLFFYLSAKKAKDEKTDAVTALNVVYAWA